MKARLYVRNSAGRIVASVGISADEYRKLVEKEASK